VTLHFYVWRCIFMCDVAFLCVTLHFYVWRCIFMCDTMTWLIHMCDVTHSYVWRDSSIYMTWLVHVWHKSCIRVIWHTKLMHYWTTSCIQTPAPIWHCIYMCDMMIWFIYMSDMSQGADALLDCLLHWHPHAHPALHLYIWRNNLTHSHVWHDPFTCVTWPPGPSSAASVYMT